MCIRDSPIALISSELQLMADSHPELCSCRPVSYTHLDVYQRQEHYLYQFVQKILPDRLSAYFRLHTFSDPAAKMIKHIFIRIFIIKTASLIVQKITFFLYFLLNTLYSPCLLYTSRCV